jgi:hypothetical protein
MNAPLDPFPPHGSNNTNSSSVTLFFSKCPTAKKVGRISKGKAHSQKPPGVSGPGTVPAATEMVAEGVVASGLKVLSEGEDKGPTGEAVKNLLKKLADRAKKIYREIGCCLLVAD